MQSLDQSVDKVIVGVTIDKQSEEKDVPSTVRNHNLSLADHSVNRHILAIPDFRQSMISSLKFILKAAR